MNPIMMKIPPQQAISYPIQIESHLLSHPEKWLPEDCLNKKIVVITDDTVKNYYGYALLKKLKKYDRLLLSFSPGEESKNYQMKQFLEDQMLVSRCDRDTMILALGGGVVGDVAGFVAATYMRGISYIQIPTTLLAMVDSSLGGKTGINTKRGKNLIGAFWQPTAVIIDTNCLTTLPKTHLINGLIEALKMFMTSDFKSFNNASKHVDTILNGDLLTLQDIIQRAITVKINIVSQDERENGLRAILNFGHTMGHALEKIMNYTLLHGYAVALGILVEAKISQLLGFLSDVSYQTIQALFLKLSISADLLKKIDIEKLIMATKRDKKIKSGNVRYVLLKNIGQVYNEGNNFIHPVTDEIVRNALLEIRED
ncbi:MAG: aroB [Gammaproteobacteria bacterium]|nr:aroB [Gammaproteobacteria bacterium]